MGKFQYSLSPHLSVQCSDNSKSQLIILILPAMGAPTKLYKRLYEGILKADLGAAIMSLRGEGLLEKEQLVSDNNFGYVELLKDIDDVIAFISNKYPDKSIMTIGHSLGGQLGCLYSCHKNSKVLASIVIAGGNVGYQSWSGIDRIKTLCVTQFFGIISKFFGWFPGKRIGFGGNQPKNIMIDWSRNARTGIYKLTNQKVDYENVAKEVKSLFLGIVIANDFFAPYASTKSLLDKFPSSDREISIINADSFKKVSPNHFSWLKEPEPAINTFLSWLYEKGMDESVCKNTKKIFLG